MKHKYHVTYEKVLEAIENTKTMNEASTYLNMNYRTFKRVAEEHGLYKPIAATWKKKFELTDILEGKYPWYSTAKLSKRLVDAKLLDYKCNKCGITEYNGEHISLELNHIDGNNKNHSLINLELVCPNCHSQTPTYRSKKLKTI
jgi:ribosomal protein L44E